MTGEALGDAMAKQARVEFSLREEAARVVRLEAEADMAGEAVATEQANRRLRNVEVVSVVLVIVNYLFPGERGKYA